MKYRVLPYRQGSKGAKALATALGGKVLKLEGSTFQPSSSSIIINWGNTSQFQKADLNGIDLREATNKRNFFERMVEKGLQDLIPPFATDRAGAEQFLSSGGKVVCRTTLAGHSGEGIVIASTPDELVSCPLYVKYVKKTQEYRVHVGKVPNHMHVPEGETIAPKIIAVQRKARRTSVPDGEVNWQIRNHDNGFVYTRNGFNPPASVLDAARRCLAATALDFGAVDVIWNDQKGKPYVLEINTAPGLEGQTIADYANFFRSL